MFLEKISPTNKLQSKGYKAHNNSDKNIIKKNDNVAEQYILRTKRGEDEDEYEKDNNDEDIKTQRARISYCLTDRNMDKLDNFNMDKFKTKSNLDDPDIKFSKMRSRKSSIINFLDEIDKKSKKEKIVDEEDDGLCYICYANPSDCIYLDCGHGGVCLSCAMDTIKKNNICTLCRKPVTQLIEIDPTTEIRNGVFMVLNSYYVSVDDVDNSGKEYANLPPVDPPLNGAENSNIGPANE